MRAYAESLHPHGALVRAGDHELVLDQPPEHGMAPIEALLSALAGDAVIQAEKAAKELQIGLKASSALAELTSTGVNLTLTLWTERREQADKIAKRVEESSKVMALLSRGVRLKLTAVWRKPLKLLAKPE
ncbi:MAG: hypothetical protein DRN96_04355 [Thermoproteota archaeon]|nr:MAG: hypothetical protein DRN96_04355 [Candidatus Korarchaeota archaeon]RLG55009.1 MAG: hypothetical protein DRN99_03905 [Candidatus Korarchaeota archaeon]